MSVLTSLVGPVTGLLDKFIEDKDQKAALAHEIATMGQNMLKRLCLLRDKQGRGGFRVVLQRRMAAFCGMDLWYCFCISLCASTTFNIYFCVYWPRNP